MDKIPSIVRSSIQTFGILITLLETTDPAQAAIAQSHLARFKLWAGSLGAQRISDSQSLTYRLRDASRIRSHVISLLEELQCSLEDAYSFLDSSHVACSVPEYDSIDMDLASLLGDTEPVVSDGLSPVSELSKYLTEIKEIIDCLLRLSVTLSNPAPHDQFRPRVDVNTPPIEPYDINHVQETFPILNSAVIERLGRAMTQRRQYIKYRADQHRRLQEDSEIDEAEHAKSESCGVTGLSTVPQDMRDSTQIDVAVSKRPASENSATSYSRSNTVDESEISVPPMPKNDGGEPLLCQFCFMLISVETWDGWKKHVFGDLRAYVCIWGDCVSPGRDFQTRRDWIRHMTTEHWREWSCPFGCTAVYDDCKALEIHLRGEHAGGLTTERVDQVSALSSRPNLNRAEGSCPMCQKVEIRSIHAYESHIGHHLEQLALFALQATSSSDGDDNDDGNIETGEHEEKPERRLENEPRTPSKSADVDIHKMKYTQVNLQDSSSGSGSDIEESFDKGIQTELSRIEVDDQDKSTSQYLKTAATPIAQKANYALRLVVALVVVLLAVRPLLTITLLFLVLLIREFVDQLRPKRLVYIQEKKWFCAWCHFGPLDWSNDQACLECGLSRLPRVEYQTRKVWQLSEEGRRRTAGYVQEKKWFCIRCNFGPLDWSYDEECLECGWRRDQYWRIEYQTRKVWQ